MFGEHPKEEVGVHYEFGCTWYVDHGPFYSNLQPAWFIIGLPCIVATVLALSSTFYRPSHGRDDSDNVQSPADLAASSSLYGPLIDTVDGNVDVDGYVHRWVGWGACGAILHGVLLAVLGVACE
eukprot:CAMPEP_0180520178 /NCGR_PEP_ID=MMETSP1036_2-20121128/56115_1 /TAXON_ID=632150 /ORGANISM="Azadinium spinosum, Strain 3D9" /LENGTH=123 /DNA_ID=CAMNT_0022532631 /DNA_START=20 /DNA_END=391 /DNA_ORIENTATION=+